MDRAEVVDRLRQEVSKRVDTALGAFGYNVYSEPSVVVQAPQPRFFFTPESIDGLLALMRTRFTRQTDEIVRSANRAHLHCFDLLGYQDLYYGENIDWHLDRVHGKHAPILPFYKVPYLNFDRVGDVKVTWELNRHQHFVKLAITYRLTGDDRYARELLEQWRRWHEQNPYPLGVNWASSLEVAFRSLSWLWVYFLLESSQAMTPAFRSQLLRALEMSARHVERYLSTYSSPNTHLLGEGAALFFIGTLCPELRSSPRWRRRGWSIVLQEADRQVRRDGMHFEQSVYYHVYALDIFLHCWILASLNRVPVPCSLTIRIERMLDVLAQIARSGAPPNLGDDDGGRLFDGRRNSREQMTDPLATGAICFARGDFKSIVSEPPLETLWLLGEAALSTWDSLPSRIRETRSFALEDCGIHCMAWDDPLQQLFIDAGPLGALRAGHGHADALSICLRGMETDLLVDAGTYEYVEFADKRKHFRGTAAHNTLQVDGRDQTETQGSFEWETLPCILSEQWTEGTFFDLFCGSHDGYRRLDQPVTHRRWVFSMKSKFWLVRDLAEGEGTHRLDLRWHLGPNFEQQSTQELRFVSSEGSGLGILPMSGHDWSEKTSCTLWSPVYGVKQPIQVVEFETVRSLPADFATIVLSTSESLERPGVLTEIPVQAGTPARAYRYHRPGEEYIIVFAQAGPAWDIGLCGSDAEFLCWNTNENQDSILIFCNGSWVQISDRKILQCTAPVAHCELVLGRDGVRVFCSDPEAFQLTMPQRKHVFVREFV